MPLLSPQFSVSPFPVAMIGFGSQGSAWAQALRNSGWQVRVYLHREGSTFTRAQELGFEPQILTSSTFVESRPHWVIMACPDQVIGEVYRTFLSSIQAPLRLVLIHGYSIYSNDLQFSHVDHSAALLAPKAIGPKLLENYFKASPDTHSLSAGFYALPEDQGNLKALARGLGFAESNLISTSFHQEAIGDLISEQGLLCGGIFNLLLWTMEAMQEAGIPPQLIQEECITELELIAGLIRDKGPGTAFSKISQAAQCGTVAMGQRLEQSSFKEEFLKQIQNIKTASFVQYERTSPWQVEAVKLKEKLLHWENRFQEKKL